MKKLPFSRNFTLQFALALALFVTSAYWASHQTLSQLETDVFNVIYDNPHWMRPFFQFITQLGSVYVLMALACVYLFMRHYRVVIRLLMSGLLAYLLAGVAKDLYGRPRPAELLDIVVNDFFVRGPGFPSGHTALATAMGLTLARYIPRKYVWLVPVGIILVAWSRVFLGAHAPLDLVGGFALGWMATLLFRNVKLSNLPESSQKAGLKALKKR